MDNKNLKVKENSFLILTRAFDIIKASGIFDKLSDAELVKVIAYCTAKKWLRFQFEDDKLVFVGCGYRIKHFDPADCKVLPTQEEGNILYCPFMVSISTNKNYPMKVLKQYLKDNPDVDEIIFYRDGINEPVRYTRKGEMSGKK